MTAFLYVGLLVFWVSLAIGVFLLYRKNQRNAERRHEEELAKQETRQELFEDEDEL